jgi:hypothetical protein
MRFQTLTTAEAEAASASALLCGEVSPEVKSPPDGPTVNYVLEIRPAFDTLHHAGAQIAAWFILAETGGEAEGPDHPLLAAARRSFAEAAETIRSVRATPRAAHHHHHLRRAETAIEAVLGKLSDARQCRDPARRDLALAQLKSGWREMHHAAAALPGFEMVQLSGACCAVHRNALARDN